MSRSYQGETFLPVNLRAIPALGPYFVRNCRVGDFFFENEGFSEKEANKQLCGVIFAGNTREMGHELAKFDSK